jgi:hypothetical protein
VGWEVGLESFAAVVPMGVSRWRNVGAMLGRSRSFDSGAKCLERAEYFIRRRHQAAHSTVEGDGATSLDG